MDNVESPANFFDQHITFVNYVKRVLTAVLLIMHLLEQASTYPTNFDHSVLLVLRLLVIVVSFVTEG